VGIGSVVALLHLRRDLVVGLRDHALDGDTLVVVPQGSKGKDLGHGNPIILTVKKGQTSLLQASS
jgi:hypothetical protein